MSLFSSKAPITFILSATLLCVYVVQFFQPVMMGNFVFTPSMGVDSYQFFTGAFLHGTPVHLAMNLLALLLLGSAFESATGSLQMLLVYVVSLVCGQFAVAMWSAPDVVTVGASGAIYGVFAGVLVVDLLGKLWSSLVSNIFVLGINIMYSFSVPHISWEAHIGGFIGGLVVSIPLVALVYYRARRQRRRTSQLWQDRVKNSGAQPLQAADMVSVPHSRDL